MSIPDIPDFSSAQYEDLIENLLNGTCIFFGAGISKLAGYRLWRELANGLVERFWDRKDDLLHTEVIKFDYSLREYLKTHSDEVEVFEYLYQLDKKMFVEEIRFIFNKDERNLNEKIFLILNNLNNGKNFFITTNIDTGFQKYSVIEDTSISIIPNFSELPKMINYLHGRLDKEESWIFTKGQYIKNYDVENAPCLEFIINIFRNYSVIFIGYGLREREILLGITRSKNRRRHYWLEPSYKGKEDYLKTRATCLKENYNIVLVPYFIDNNGNGLLYEVLDELYKMIK